MKSKLSPTATGVEGEVVVDTLQVRFFHPWHLVEFKGFVGSKTVT